MWNKQTTKVQAIQIYTGPDMDNNYNCFHYYVIYLTPSWFLYIQYEQVMSFMTI